MDNGVILDECREAHIMAIHKKGSKADPGNYRWVSAAAQKQLCNHCYLDLPQLCLGTLYYPSVTMGDSLTASKRPETSPKPTNFPLSTSNVISVQSYHSKKDHAITVLSRPTSTVSRHTISPISDHGDPSKPQNGQKQASNQQIFLCPPPT